MRDDGNIGTALGAETVDARFWALVCDDEEWLRSEFDGIVGGPAEHPDTVPPATVVTIDRVARGAGAGVHRDRAGGVRPWRSAAVPGRAWRRQRSPPVHRTTHVSASGRW